MEGHGSAVSGNDIQSLREAFPSLSEKLLTDIFVACNHSVEAAALRLLDAVYHEETLNQDFLPCGESTDLDVAKQLHWELNPRAPMRIECPKCKHLETRACALQFKCSSCGTLLEVPSFRHRQLSPGGLGANSVSETVPGAVTNENTSAPTQASKGRKFMQAIKKCNSTSMLLGQRVRSLKRLPSFRRSNSKSSDELHEPLLDQEDEDGDDTVLIRKPKACGDAARDQNLKDMMGHLNTRATNGIV